MTYVEAATVPFGGRDALHFLGKGNIQSGQKILINGAGGSIGTYAVQLAKHFGTEVTGVDSTGNLDMVRSIGAGQVVDDTQEDFAQKGQHYDLVFDVVAKLSFSECEPALGPKGIYVTTAFSPGLAFGGLWSSMTGGKKLVPLMGKPPSVKDHVFMKELLEAGKVTPVIDRRYKLSEVPEALRYLEEGHTRGKIVVTM